MKLKNMLFNYMTALLLIACVSNLNAQDVTFPRAFGIAIDDMGWNQGSSLGDKGGPWRIGVRRTLDINDYTPMVNIGKAVGVRFQGLFIMSEMDRANVCAKYPTTTQQGSKFDNSANVNDEQIKIMDYMKNNSAYFEFGIHGVGHEHFENGVRTRAEWYDTQHDKPWSEQDSRDHIQCFKEILTQYGITKENGHSFPESYVPCAYGYYWNPDGKVSTGKVMSDAGVKYANTLFEEVKELNPPIEFGGGFDHGVLVISRYNYGNEWFKLAALPVSPLEEYKSDVIETHFSNWLAQDYYLQNDLNNQWIVFFKNIQKNKDHYLAKNTEQLYSQWLYNHFTKVDIKNGVVAIDNSKMPQVVYDYKLLGNMVLKVKLVEGMHVSSATINGKPVSAYFEDEGYGFIYLPQLATEKYTVTYTLGKSLPAVFVNNTGTYNVYNVESTAKKLSFALRMYGTQPVQVKCSKPVKVESNNPNLKILNNVYDNATGMLSLDISGRDMQGESGLISITY